MTNHSLQEVNGYTERNHRGIAWIVILGVFAACFVLFSTSCSHSKCESPRTAASVGDAMDQDEEESCDCDCPGYFDNPDFNYNYAEHLSPIVQELVKFGRRHEIQGDFGDDKWATLEPTLPAPVLETAPGQDLIQSFQSTLNLNCHAGASSDMLIYCSKPDMTQKDKNYSEEYGDYDGDEDYEDYDDCCNDFVDYLYLCLKDSTANVRRCYEIESEFYTDFEDGNTVGGSAFDIVDIETRPFMDTTGLYIRTKRIKDSNSELAPGCYIEKITTYTTWLFAGDKQRLVTHWEDSEYRYSFSQDDIYSDGDYIRSDIDYHESYTEGYMYYRSGKFELEEKDVIEFSLDRLL